jgi:hypothetical protein
MRNAYREFATPSMLAFCVLIMTIIVVPFTIWDPWHLRLTLSVIQHVGFSVAVSVCDVLICYSGAFLALYVTRMCPWQQALLTVAVVEVMLAAPCTANLTTAYSILHGGRTPDVPFLELYLMVAVNVLAATAATWYVLRLRIGHRRLLATQEAATSRLPREEHCADHAPDHDPRAERPYAAPSPVRWPAAVTATAVDAPGGPEPDRDADDRDESPRKKPAKAGSATAKSLRDRLNGPLDDIVYLHVSGHYLEVITLSGSAVFLKRLADAVAELGDRGMQTHRSYWVAYRHVIRLVRRDHRMVLLLANDHEVPVSHSYLPAVRDFTARTTASAVPEQSDSGPEEQAGSSGI